MRFKLEEQRMASLLARGEGMRTGAALGFHP
jgi:hypothetical protein